MFILLPFVLAFAGAAHAGTSCEADTLVDRSSPTARYANRKTVPEGQSLESVLARLIDTVPPHAPILIMDTNPNPDRWADWNIVAPATAAALFPDRTYQSLTAAERGRLFADYFARVNSRADRDERPFLIIDHHFPSPLLADASTTPLVVDFLGWLFDQPPTFARERLRAVFTHGVIIRDHADADVILASFAARLADRPADLAHYGPLLKRVAMMHDHPLRPYAATSSELIEDELALAWLIAAESYITGSGPGAFEATLAKLTPALAIIASATIRIPPGSPDVVAALMKLGVVPGRDEVWD